MSNIKQLATSRQDLFSVPLELLEVQEGFNIRTDLGDIKALSAGIRLHGYQKPFVGRKNAEDRFILTDGHRNREAGLLAVRNIRIELQEAKGDREATARLKEELERVSSVPFQSEAAGKTELQRSIELLIRNNGKPLTMLEEASLLNRFEATFGMSEKEVRRLTGWSKTHIANLIILRNACSPKLRAAVQSGKISATLAVEMARKQPDMAEQDRMTEEALRRAAEAGRPQATAKHLNDADREKVAPSTSKKKAAARASGGGQRPAPSDRKKQVNTDTGGQESILPQTDQDPATHIIALRDKFKADPRSKNAINTDRFRTLNFIADYLKGGRYTHEQFEKFFTEFFLGQDR